MNGLLAAGAVAAGTATEAAGVGVGAEPKENGVSFFSAPCAPAPAASFATGVEGAPNVNPDGAPPKRDDELGAAAAVAGATVVGAGAAGADEPKANGGGFDSGAPKDDAGADVAGAAVSFFGKRLNGSWDGALEVAADAGGANENATGSFGCAAVGSGAGGGAAGVAPKSALPAGAPAPPNPPNPPNVAGAGAADATATAGAAPSFFSARAVGAGASVGGATPVRWNMPELAKKLGIGASSWSSASALAAAAASTCGGVGALGGAADAAGAGTATAGGAAAAVDLVSEKGSAAIGASFAGAPSAGAGDDSTAAAACRELKSVASSNWVQISKK